MEKIIITLSLMICIGITYLPINASDFNCYIQYDQNGSVVTEHMPQNIMRRAGAHTNLTPISSGSKYHPQTNTW